MSVEASQPLRTWSFELRDWLAQLRSRTILSAMPVLYVVGALLLFAIEALEQPYGHIWVPLVAFSAALAQLIWRRRAPLLAGWALALGSLVLVLAVVTWWGLEPAICLLASPVGLAFLAIGTTAGMAMSAACTLLLLFAPGALLPVAPLLRAVALAAIWSTAGMMRLTLHPLVATVQWAWSNYEEGRAALERARDYQVQLREALEDLSSANAQLTRANQLANALRQVAEDERRAKEQFVANVSHELRTPLNMIIGFCEMMSESPEVYGKEVPPALLADVNVVLRNSRHLADLVDDVLDLSQIQGGQIALTRERASIDEIIEGAVVAVRPLYESKGLYLSTDVPDGLPQVYCDRTRIREVVLNLLSNAGRFTERGGVRLRAWREAGDLLVAVTDTGVGIAAEDQARLFQPFQQVDGSIRRRYGGTGLGLSISRALVELHGGKMWLESQKGSGTTVTFRLPVDPPVPVDGGPLRWVNPYQAEERPSRQSRLKPVSVPRRIVLVESGDTMRRLVSRYADAREVVSAADLERGIEELSESSAQVLLVNAPSIGDTLGRLSEARALPGGVPAIVCTVPGVEETTGALGVVDYLVKPVSREGLLAALDRLGRELRTVLVVDDEQDALQLFSRMLTSSGRAQRVLRAVDGRQALQMLRQDRPDLVMLDLFMPEMSGFEFLAAKNQDAELRDVPVILVSARDPFGQPVVSNALAVTRANGLSVRELLACIEALSAILSPGSQQTGRALRAALPGSPAFG
ncbi:MAG: ATP-binding protein [Anaerolineae bacterium]|nr:ATP-binding protein [Anaerolineae bacterium]